MADNRHEEAIDIVARTLICGAVNVEIRTLRKVNYFDGVVGADLRDVIVKMKEIANTAGEPSEVMFQAAMDYLTNGAYTRDHVPEEYRR
jgi:hypothetical protein